MNFDILMSLLAKSFAFPLHIEQVFFADDLNNHEWNVVLWKESRGTRVVSRKGSMPNIGYLSLGNVEDHCGLVPTSLDNDATPTYPILNEVVVWNSDQVVVGLNTNDDEPSYEDEDEFGIEGDGHALID